MKAIVTKFHGPTNSRGSRMGAVSEGNRVMITLDPVWTRDIAHQEAAKALCIKMGWSGVLVQGSLKSNSEVFVWHGVFNAITIL